MSVIYVLIPIAIILTIIGIYLFFWAVKSEQFNDLEKEGLSILFDDEQLKNNSQDKPQTAQNSTIDETEDNINK
ncbi:cbb3-type cytochrome oxidase assembly protein CcoS [Thalassotalea sp. M1531]|uniref:Cbb3-type cytochrome oxidase assembly protein CcoS n=1 Tax=Thalassotalea algicola TaxID=2716224 RepID=A0A7Y0LC23_9GAMM|nr:cbb3-type cytochrome oxidase assembly protein CcoS [Thalassotalea algicola]NMP31469.1 cbb3-type cytochrome oxidase assembly protein CcoS [Thalassotalea algicola]